MTLEIHLWSSYSIEENPAYQVTIDSVSFDQLTNTANQNLIDRPEPNIVHIMTVKFHFRSSYSLEVNPA